MDAKIRLNVTYIHQVMFFHTSEGNRYDDIFTSETKLGEEIFFNKFPVPDLIFYPVN